ncbi:hypothetical protein AB5Q65_002479, partial [Salmonella enterica]
VSGSTVSGTSSTGTGSTISGHLVSDSTSSVSGTSAKGDGLALNGGTLTGGKVTGHSEIGNGVITTGHSKIDGAVVNATSSQGHGLNVQGELQKTPGTTLDASTMHGMENIIMVTNDGADTGEMATRVRQHQSAISAMAAHGAMPSVAGFLSQSAVPVPQSEYRAAEQRVALSVCDGSDCQSLEMDANGPQPFDVTPEQDDVKQP